MDRDSWLTGRQLGMLHLKSGSGAEAEIREIRLSGLSLPARWLVRGDEFFLELLSDVSLQDSLLGTQSAGASVAVFLDTGIHTFEARLKKQADPRLFKAAMVRDVGVMQQRKWVRVPIELAVVYKTQGDQPVEARGLARDLSCGGMKLIAEGQLEVGCGLSVKFVDEPWASLGELESRVVWKSNNDDRACYGIAFETIPQAKMNLMIELLAQEARRQRALKRTHSGGSANSSETRSP
ncbi:MAG TPA: PilZ domain-containing protein [Firmicutes bacterium]|nr:PilZ domain-containing protein [Candidatus Fermentithermobacillaceae bacterium]